eukprot:gene49418-64622_t
MLSLLVVDVAFMIADQRRRPLAHILCDAKGAGLVCGGGAGVPWVNLTLYGTDGTDRSLPQGCHIDIDQVIPHDIHMVEEVLSWLSFLILVAFLAESLMLLAGYGPAGRT